MSQFFDIEQDIESLENDSEISDLPTHNIFKSTYIAPDDFDPIKNDHFIKREQLGNSIQQANDSFTYGANIPDLESEY